MLRLLTTLLLIAAFCGGAALSYFNWAPVRVDYLAGEAELPLVVLLLAAFLIGMLVMGMINLARVFTLQRQGRRQARQIRELEAELKSLRSLPLAQGDSPASGSPAGNA